MTFRSIVVPLDGSRFGEPALSHALSLVRRSGARLALAHVAEPPPYSEISLTTAVRDEHAADETARGYLEEVSRRVRAASPSVEVEPALLRGRVAGALCEFVGRSNPDLVVLTTHGRGPLSRFWFGSVATDLVHLVFLLVTPAERPQLQVLLLGQVARIAGAPEQRRRLRAAASPAEVGAIVGADPTGPSPPAARLLTGAAALVETPPPRPVRARSHADTSPRCRALPRLGADPPDLDCLRCEDPDVRALRPGVLDPVLPPEFLPVRQRTRDRSSLVGQEHPVAAAELHALGGGFRPDRFRLSELPATRTPEWSTGDEVLAVRSDLRVADPGGAADERPDLGRLALQ